MNHLKEKPNRHLEHTIIPEPPRMNSLEDFLDRFRPPLSFFAKRISHGDRHSLLRNAEKRGSLIPPNHSKQATLYTAQMHRISGLTPVSRRFCATTESGLHGNWVGFRMPLQAAQSHSLPATAPIWAKEAITRNFIDMPFGDILPPPPSRWNLTRILHHHLIILYIFL